MKTLLTLIIFTLSFNLLAADDFLYINYSTFNDQDGETKNNLLKVALPAENIQLQCEINVSFKANGSKPEVTTYQIEYSKEMGLFNIFISYLEGDELDNSTSVGNFSESLNELYAFFTAGDGYVENSLQAGSFSKVQKIISLMSEENTTVSESDFLEIKGKTTQMIDQNADFQVTLTSECFELQ